MDADYPIEAEDWHREKVTGLILAGGAGMRVGGADKGLIEWRGRPLIAHVSERLKPQVGELLVSCNRNNEDYASYGNRTVRDNIPGYQGPLAGICAAAPMIKTPLLAVCPCDSPAIPENMVFVLASALLQDEDNDVSFAACDGRRHYLCAVLRVSTLRDLSTFLDGGGRAVKQWYGQLRCREVEFAEPSAFLNLNTL